MRLEGVGGSTAVAFPSSNVTNQVGTGGNRVNNERKEVDNQGRPEKAKYVGEKRYSEEEVIDFIEKANQEFIAYDRRFEFSIHEKTKHIMIKILDSATGDIIKELPPENILDMVAGFMEAAGMIVDKKI